MMATGGAIRAGRAFVELFADRTQLTRGLKYAQTQFGAFRVFVQRMSFGIAGEVSRMFAALLPAGILSVFALAAKSYQNMGDAIHKTGIRTGLSAEALTSLSYAAELSGAHLDDVTSALGNMQGLLLDAVKGNQDAAFTFTQLGLSVGHMLRLNPEQQFLATAEALSRVTNGTLRATMANKLFGGSGAALLPLLADGAKGIRSLQKEAEALGLVMSQDDANAAAAQLDSWTRLWKTMGAVQTKIAASLAPSLTGLFNTTATGIATLVKWIDANRDTVQIIALVVAGATAGVGSILALGAAFAVSGAVINGVISTFGALGAVMGVAQGLLIALSSPLVRFSRLAWQASGALLQLSVALLRSAAGMAVGLAKGISLAIIDLASLAASAIQTTSSLLVMIGQGLYGATIGLGRLAIAAGSATGSLASMAGRGLAPVVASMWKLTLSALGATVALGQSLVGALAKLTVPLLSATVSCGKFILSLITTNGSLLMLAGQGLVRLAQGTIAVAVEMTQMSIIMARMVVGAAARLVAPLVSVAFSLYRVAASAVAATVSLLAFAAQGVAIAAVAVAQMTAVCLAWAVAMGQALIGSIVAIAVSLGPVYLGLIGVTAAVVAGIVIFKEMGGVLAWFGRGAMSQFMAALRSGKNLLENFGRAVSSIAGSAVNGLKGLFTGILQLTSGTMSAIAGSIGGAIAGVTSLAQWFVQRMGDGLKTVLGFFVALPANFRSVLGQLGPLFGAVGDWFRETFSNIWDVSVTVFNALKNALAGGDWGAAANLLWATLQLAWIAGTSELMKSWTQFKHAAVDVMIDISATLSKIWVETIDVLADAWSTFLTSFRKGWNDASTWLGNLLIRMNPMMTAEQKAEEIRDNNMISGDFNKGLDAQRDRDLMEREQKRKDRIAGITAEQDEQKKAHGELTSSQLTDSGKALKDAQEAFQEALKNAQGVGVLPGSGAMKLPGIAAGLVGQAGERNGTFSSAAGRMYPTLGSNVSPLQRLAEKGVEELGRIRRAAEDSKVKL